MDDWKREFALGEVLADAFCFCVGRRREVHVVVPDLEEEADGVDEGDIIPSHHSASVGRVPPVADTHTQKERQRTSHSGSPPASTAPPA